jgi:hypothetical protein
LGLKLSPLTTRLPRCNIKPAQLKAIITGEALPSPL